MTYTLRNTRQTGGYTLIEVLVGILIFAVGMMALAQLQGSLAQNSGDANARTVAINVAEEVMETVRSFAQITSDGSTQAFNDIVDGTSTVTRAGYTYSIVTDVTDYYYVPASKTFADTKPEGSSAANPDFKHIELTVAWEEDGGREFRVDDDTTANMGSGSVTISDVISSITSPASGKVLLGTGGDDTMYAPPVDYSPGQNPDIVSINLGKNKFKESTTPLPDVIRTDELVETRFDVVTYSNPINSGATFLRREEFMAVSCECTLRFPDTATKGGLRPTVWTGSVYTEGEFVSKPYGESANNQQSEFCDICCRDHHDGGVGTQDDSLDPGRAKYMPFREGDHEHYNRDRNGILVLAESDGDIYLEACRLVRKDGFFRVAQDMRQESLNAFPADYLDAQDEIDVYSGFVTAAVIDYEMGLDDSDSFLPYEGNPPPFQSSADQNIMFPASNPFFPTQMSQSGVSEQQLRSRGIYVDYMSDELRLKIRCLNNRVPGSTDDCDVPEVSSALEIIPFYDVQLTWLSRWNESPNNNPIDVSNQAINDHNSHSRGMAKLTEGKGSSTISSMVHTGNLGLTGTDPIDPYYAANETQYDMYATADDSGTPPTLSNIKVYGEIISSVPGVKAADVEIVGSEALCDRTNTGFECVLLADAKSPSMKVTNYTKADKLLVACSAELLLAPPRGHISLNGTGNWTNFSLDIDLSLTTDIIIKEGGC